MGPLVKARWVMSARPAALLLRQDEQAETRAWEGSKVKLLPCPDPQQKVPCCQALISGGALLTLHLLPSVPALSPFLCGKDETSLETGCCAACRFLPPSTAAFIKLPIKPLKSTLTHLDAAVLHTKCVRTSQLPLGGGLQYINQPNYFPNVIFGHFDSYYCSNLVLGAALKPDA